MVLAQPGRMPLQSWLQEQQYSTPYHWRQRPNDEREYCLRTDIVFELAGLSSWPCAREQPRLLDLGCGDGRFSAQASDAARVVGIDVSPRALHYAAALVRGATFIAAAGASVPFRADSFDIVVLLDVIEHIPDRDERRVVAEAVRVLRRGGRLVISTNTDRSARELKHYRHYPLPRFRSLFDGLDGIQLTGMIPYFPTLRFWMAAPITSRLAATRVRRCAPEAAHVVIGSGTRP
jgi:SAM-dependent methyltransferase